jgi:tetratricopeptide (TPR) repeat protein
MDAFCRARARKQSRMARHVSALCLSGAVLLGSLSARAEDTHAYVDCRRQPTDAEVSAAKGAFQAGQASFNEADYPRAITYWEDAYRRDCTAHALLLNLARAYELNGQKHQAVIALETFLLRRPDIQQRDQIERRIETLNSQIAQEENAPTRLAPAATPAIPQVAATPLAVSSHEETRHTQVAPLVVAGAGGALALVSGILYFKARSDLNAAKDRCPRGDCIHQSEVDDGQSANTRVNVFGTLALGGLAVGAGGLVWYFVTRPKQTSSEAAGSLPKRSLPQI